MDTNTGDHDNAPNTHSAREPNGSERPDKRSDELRDDRATEHQELDDNEGADAFETEESARTTRRPNSGERQDEELISLDPPD